MGQLKFYTETIAGLKDELGYKDSNTEDYKILLYALQFMYICEEDFIPLFNLSTTDLETRKIISIIKDDIICITIPEECLLYLYQKFLERGVKELLDGTINGKKFGELLEEIAKNIRKIKDQKKRGDVEAEALALVDDSTKYCFVKEHRIINPGDSVISQIISEFRQLDFRTSRKMYGSIVKYPAFQPYLINELSGDYSLDYKFHIIDFLHIDSLKIVNDFFCNEFGLSAFARLVYSTIDNKPLPNKDKIFQFIGKLPLLDQLRLFRYLIHIKEEEEFDLQIEELYDAFIRPKKPICETIKYVIESIYTYHKGNDPCRIVFSSNIFEEINNCTRNGWYKYSSLMPLCQGVSLFKKDKFENKEWFITKIGKVENINDQYVISLYSGFYVKSNHLFICRYKDLGLIRLSIENIPNECNELHTKIRSVIENNFSFEEIGHNRFIIKNPDKQRLRLLVLMHKLEDKCELLKTHYEGVYLETLPFDKHHSFAARFPIHKTNDERNGVPYCRCGKKFCSGCHRLCKSKDLWFLYQLPDFIRIFQEVGEVDYCKLWNYVATLSSTINEEVNIIESNLDKSSKYEFVEQDMEILEPLKSVSYDYIMSFYKALRRQQKMRQNKISAVEEESEYYEDDNYEECQTYDNYNGTYAQDQMGYSDDDIDTIFEGDPDAYWNID